uniref:RGS domain-containing protein n=1 Tax=Parastrongyloides trichosuri TaxID=131310 RepID=A0A0N4ZMQ2_PARTI
MNRNKLLHHQNVLSDDFMGCTNDEYDTSIIHEEFPVSRQKRKFEDGSPLCQLLAKRPSLGETLSGGAVSPYNDCYYDDNSCNKEDESNHASSSATDLFYKTIGDNLLRKPFMEYLEEQFCQENLIFYVAVQEYRLTHNDDKRIILGKQIVRDHLEDDSPDQINIDNRTRTAIIQKANQENYNIELFDCAQFQITEMMKFDIWPRYLKAIDSRKMTTINKNPEKPPFVKSRLSLNNLKNKLFGKKSSKTSIETANYIWNCKNPHRKEDRFSLHFDTIGKSFRSAKKINIEKTNGDPKFERNNSLSSSMSIKHLKSFH